MSLEIIITLMGVILVLAAVLGSIQKEDSESRFIGIQLTIPMGLLGIMLIIYGGYSFGAVNLRGEIEQVETGNKLKVEYPVTDVKIISPLMKDSVACRILTMGVYPEGHDKDIWVLVEPSNDRYYPQSDHTNTSFKRKGEWQVITRFGGDKGESYEIIAYETDQETSQFFSSTIQTWKDSLAYPGLALEDIPDGAKEVDRITVSLQENCRGVF